MTHWVTKAVEAAIVEAIRAGTSRTDLARQYGLARSTISRISKRNGIPRKKSGRGGGWPDCPEHLRAEYARFIYSKGYRAAEAKAMVLSLQASAEARAQREMAA